LSLKAGARHVVHETVHDAPRRSAWQRLFGSDGDLVPDLGEARVIVSLDSDFLDSDGPMLASTHGFAKGRSLDESEHTHATLNRLYVFESAMTVTGSNADERRPMRPSQMAALANALRRAVEGEEAAIEATVGEAHVEPELLAALVKDLRAHSGEAVVVAGPHLPESVHVAVAAINRAIGAFGKTLAWSPEPAALPVTPPEVIEKALAEGVDLLLCLGVNPAYDWPGGGFGELLKKAKVSVGHGLHLDETLEHCTFALPSAHNLESWNDAVPAPKVLSLCQPLIAPLFNGRQEAESLLFWTQAVAPPTHASRAHGDWYVFVRNRVVAALNGAGYPAKWDDVLKRGVFELAGEAPAMPPLDEAALGSPEAAEAPAGSYELLVLPHHGVYDGRFANNGWLQELPDPVSKVVWGNVAALAPDTAEELGVEEGDVVRVAVGDRHVHLPALIQHGTAPGVVVVTLGHGRTGGGLVAQEAAGVNVAPLLGAESAAHPRVALAVKVEKTGGREKVVRTQLAFSMDKRPIVTDGTLAEFRHDPAFVQHKRHTPDMVNTHESPYDYSKGHKWVMAIDLGACTGCNACITACQAENNIPVVGREECANGRDMHWMRLDRYEEGDPDNPAVHNMPMLCQHCDNAPCESVCPVNATVHSPEGLNEMVFNRCVGTRFCANNCPYKVRRFNYGHYQEKSLSDPVQELAHNPQVTVRGVGVMEKCTFCVQRINAVKFEAQNANEPVPDGAVQTACQQACPAQAIVFGDVNDPESRIAKLRKAGRAFHVLEELNTRPNVAYLARVRNPALETPHEDGGDHHA
jgi:molybdopterin-containing oxidoreductase family iron-sulfur binding subunit